MTDGYISNINQIIRAKQKESQEIIQVLAEFRENLYSALEETLKELRAVGLGDVFSEPERFNGDTGEGLLKYTADTWELVYIPVPRVSYDPDAPYSHFADVPTARIFVFPNKPDSSVFYSYWVTRNRLWAGQRLGWTIAGETGNRNMIKDHVRTFLSDIFTDVSSHWNPINTITLNSDMLSGQKPPMGFGPNLRESPNE